MIGELTRDQIAASPSTTLLYDDWYPALRSAEVGGKRMAKAMLLGIPLVVGRTAAGRYFAMRDACPHRGIPLSYGWFDGQQVTCKYHGWAFEPVSGQCRGIPSLTSNDSLDPSRIYAAAFPCEERDGHVWVYVPQPGRGKLRLTTPHNYRLCPKFRSSASDIAPPISQPNCRATWTTASLV